MSVDLPEPDGPMTAVSPPADTDELVLASGGGNKKTTYANLRGAVLKPGPGDAVSVYAAATGQAIEIRQGTAAAPNVSPNPIAKIVQTVAMPRASVSGDGAEAMSALLAIHGLATPGVLVGMNGVLALTGAATLPAGAAVLALSAAPPLRRPQDVEARRGDDPVQPGARAGTAVERGPALPRPQQRLLHRVLRLLQVAEHAVAVHLQLAAVALAELGEPGLVEYVHVRRGLGGQRRDQVVRLVAGNRQPPDAQDVKDLEDEAELAAEILRRFAPVGFVLDPLLVPEGGLAPVEGHRDVRRFLVAQHVDEHRGEPVHRVGRLAGRSGEVLDGQCEECPVSQRMAVEQQQPICRPRFL